MDSIYSGQMETPMGWHVIDLRNRDGDSPFSSMLQLFIESNHDQGRDSHLRCFKVYGPTPKQSTEHRNMLDLR